MPDPRTGYYVASRDWPSIPTGLPVANALDALAVITDDDVDTALASLRATSGEQS